MTPSTPPPADAPQGRRRFLHAAVAASLASLAPVAPAARTAPITMLELGPQRLGYLDLGRPRAGQAPLLLLNRFRGTVDDWDPALLDALAARRRVIALDPSGVGASTGDVAPSIPAMAAQVAEAIAALGLTQVDVLGWSLGGMVAQALLVDRPGAVRRAVLAGTTPPGGDASTRPSPEDVRAFSSVAAKPEYDRDDHRWLFFTDTPAGRAASLRSFERVRSRARRVPPVQPEQFQRQFGAIGAWFADADGHYARLRTVRQPVLVANGNQDVAFPTQHSVVLARELPAATLLIYPDAGHGFLFQHPERFAADVHRFLDQAASAEGV